MLRSRRGMGLVEVLVAGTIAVLIFAGIATMVSQSGKVERGIASNAELSEISNTVRLIIDRQAACVKSGLVGLTFNPASPETTSFAIHFPGATGPGNVYLQEGGVVTPTRKISKLRITAMAQTGTSGADRVFFSTLRIETEIVGKASTTRNPNKDFFLNLILNAANTVVTCSGVSVDEKSFGGQVSTGYYNDASHSVMVTIPFPFSCPNPSIITQSVNDSIGCSNGSGALAPCAGDPNSRSQDLHSYVNSITVTNFKVFLSTTSPVCVGISGSSPVGTPCAGISPAYRINYHVDCN